MEAAARRPGREIERLEADRQTRNRETTDTKVELAKSEERLENLRAQMRQFEEGQEERRRAIAESRQQLAECGRRAERGPLGDPQGRVGGGRALPEQGILRRPDRPARSTSAKRSATSGPS